MKQMIYVLSAVCISTIVSACGAKKEVANIPYSPDMLNGEWVITTINGSPVKAEETPFIGFDMSENRFYGNNSCNSINGEVIADTNKNMTFDKMISTLRACPDSEPERAIMNALNNTKSVEIKSCQIPQCEIVFCNADKQELLSLKKKAISFLNGEWNVTSIQGKAVSGENAPIMNLDLKDKKLSGSTGCNRMNGSIITNDEMSISFDRIATTRMACPDNQTEAPFLNALNSVKSFKVINSNNVPAIQLCNEQGKVVIELGKSK